MSNEYKDWLEDLKSAPIGSEDHNRWLLIEYPWLGIEEDEAINYIDVEDDKVYTYLDCVPKGWMKLCEDLCAELKPLLKKANFVEGYKLCQVKEKFGGLRWYDASGVPEEISAEYNALIRKYEKISFKTCVDCGAPAIYHSTGWIYPFCGYCAAHIGGEFIKISTGEKIFIE